MTALERRIVVWAVLLVLGTAGWTIYQDRPNFLQVITHHAQQNVAEEQAALSLQERTATFVDGCYQPQTTVYQTDMMAFVRSYPWDQRVPAFLLTAARMERRCDNAIEQADVQMLLARFPGSPQAVSAQGMVGEDATIPREP